MKKYLLLILCCWPLVAVSQINAPLKRELDSMYVLDQKYRDYLSNVSENQAMADSLRKALNIKEDLAGTLWTYQSRIDSLNLVRAEEIIKKYGYPGSSLVGEPTNEVVWYIIQHSPKIKVYFSMIQQAGQANELPFRLVAMMQDRLLTQQRKPQIYGTQGACYPLRAKVENNQECFIWPIEDPKNVNKRRKQAGFSDTVEENAKRMNTTYKVLTMDQAERTYNLGK